MKFPGQTEQSGDKIMPLSPKEITTDIFKEILSIAEKQLKAKIIRCAVTHPSRFNQLQMQDLYEAVKEAFLANEILEENIKFFHEPVAAAVDYLSANYHSLPEKDIHNLIIYDFGGGTTDFALIRVNKKVHPKRGVIIMPEVLAVDGHPATGGEDITDMLMKLYITEIEKTLADLKAKDTSIQEIRLPLNKDEESSLGLKEIAWGNFSELRKWTERKKFETVKTLSKENEEFGLVALPPDLKVLVNNQLKTNVFEDIEVKIKRDKFIDGFHKMLDPVVQKLKELVSKQIPEHKNIDIVLLSGQSSQFPAVKQKIQEKLGIEAEKIILIDNLKECVVRGLCILHSDELGAGMSVRVDHQGSLSATTSRIGLRVMDQGQRKFKQLVGAGEPIGQDGYSCEIRNVFFKRNTTLPLFEHMGPETDDSFREGDNIIRHIKDFKILEGIEKLESEGVKITNEMLEDADFWFRITPDQQIELEIRFSPENKIQPINFKAIRPGF